MLIFKIVVSVCKDCFILQQLDLLYILRNYKSLQWRNMSQNQRVPFLQSINRKGKKWHIHVHNFPHAYDMQRRTLDMIQFFKEGHQYS